MKPLTKGQANQLDLLVRNTWHYYPGRKYGTRKCMVTDYLISILDFRSTDGLFRRGLVAWKPALYTPGMVVTPAGFEAWKAAQKKNEKDVDSP